MKEFPLPIQDFGELFVETQQTRNGADYDFYETFTNPPGDLYQWCRRGEEINEVKKNFDGTPENDRRVFCTYVLFKPRKESLENLRGHSTLLAGLARRRVWNINCY